MPACYTAAMEPQSPDRRRAWPLALLLVLTVLAVLRLGSWALNRGPCPERLKLQDAMPLCRGSALRLRRF